MCDYRIAYKSRARRISYYYYYRVLRIGNETNNIHLARRNEIIHCSGDIIRRDSIIAYSACFRVGERTAGVYEFADRFSKEA